MAQLSRKQQLIFLIFNLLYFVSLRHHAHRQHLLYMYASSTGFGSRYARRGYLQHRGSVWIPSFYRDLLHRWWRHICHCGSTQDRTILVGNPGHVHAMENSNHNRKPP